MATITTHHFISKTADCALRISAHGISAPVAPIPPSVHSIMEKLKGGWIGVIELRMSFPEPSKCGPNVEHLRNAVKDLGAEYDPISFLWTLNLNPANFELMGWIYDIVNVLSLHGLVIGAHQAFGAPSVNKCNLSMFDKSAMAGFKASYHERDDISYAMPVRWDSTYKVWYLGIEYLKTSSNHTKELIYKRGWFNGIHNPDFGSVAACVPWNKLPQLVLESVHVLFHKEARRAIALSQHPTTNVVSYTEYSTDLDNDRSPLLCEYSLTSRSAPRQMDKDDARTGWERLVASGYIVHPNPEAFINKHRFMVNSLCGQNSTTNYALNA
jgi:hypothetical protein